MLVEEDSTPDKITLTGMAADAHANKLTIHPFTVREWINYLNMPKMAISFMTLFITKRVPKGYLLISLI